LANGADVSTNDKPASSSLSMRDQKIWVLNDWSLVSYSNTLLASKTRVYVNKEIKYQ